MIRIIAVGKIKEKYFEDAIFEYVKRLRPYTKTQIIEVQDESCPAGESGAQQEIAKEKEAERVLRNIRSDSYVVTLEINGEPMSSERFSKFLEELRLSGRSDITFVIGGSIGLAGKVSERADTRLSFSEMTFPHQLMRVILLEQIYRAFKIAKGEPYHK